MQKKLINSLLSLVVCCVLVLMSTVSAFALDDKYDIDELGMTIKIPKEYLVITRTLERDDEVFKTLGLDYDETMTAFTAANIYLQATSDDSLLKVTLTKTSDKNSEAINNYSDLSSSQRKTVLDAFLADDMYTSGVEIKHNGNIFFDMSFTQQSQSGDIYGYQCHSVINGMNINLTLQKYNEELANDEIKIVTNIANSINFDKIKRSSGLAFDWWRILLWIVILIVIALLASFVYRQYESRKQQQQANRRDRHRRNISENLKDADLLMDESSTTSREVSKSALLSDILGESYDDEVSFDELLGYDTTDFKGRANTQFDSFDIDVSNKVESDVDDFFESFESQKSEKQESHFLDTFDLSDDGDYFSDYFSKSDDYGISEKADEYNEKKSESVLKRVGYFSKNVSRMISGSSKNKRKK